MPVFFMGVDSESDLLGRSLVSRAWDDHGVGIHIEVIASIADLSKQSHWGCEIVGPPCQLLAERIRG